MSGMRNIVVAAVIAVGAASAAGGASAMPRLDPSVAQISDPALGVTQARWVCGRHRCFFEPNHRPHPRWAHPHWRRRWW